MSFGKSGALSLHQAGVGDEQGFVGRGAETVRLTFEIGTVGLNSLIAIDASIRNPKNASHHGDVTGRNCWRKVSALESYLLINAEMQS